MRVLRLPPAVPMLLAVVGVALHAVGLRISVLPWGVNYVVGTVVMVFAVGLAVWAHWSFRRRGESLAVHVKTRRIVMDGAYEWGRNPVYLAFLLAIVGLGCIINGLAVVAMVVLAFAWLNWYVIPREESRLRANLGDEYEVYTGRTRRWV